MEQNLISGKKIFFSCTDFQKCAQRTPKSKLSQLYQNLFPMVGALLPHSGQGADEVWRSSQYFSKWSILAHMGTFSGKCA